MANKIGKKCTKCGKAMSISINRHHGYEYERQRCYSCMNKRWSLRKFDAGVKINLLKCLAS